MVYFICVFGVFMLVCLALTINGSWTQANVWIVPVGVVCVAIGVLTEALRVQHAKGIAENRKGPYTHPSRDRGIGMPPDLLSIFLAASYVALGLILIMLQAMAFFWN